MDRLEKIDMGLQDGSESGKKTEKAGKVCDARKLYAVRLWNLFEKEEDFGPEIEKSQNSDIPFNFERTGFRAKSRA